MTDPLSLEDCSENSMPSAPSDGESNEFLAFQGTTGVRGYGTAHAYFSRNLPDAFRLMPDPVLDTEADFGALTIRTLERGKQVVVVEASAALKERGIHRTLAFPVGVLNRFYR